MSNYRIVLLFVNKNYLLDINLMSMISYTAANYCLFVHTVGQTKLTW